MAASPRPVSWIVGVAINGIVWYISTSTWEDEHFIFAYYLGLGVGIGLALVVVIGIEVFLDRREEGGQGPNHSIGPTPVVDGRSNDHS
jgi:hypothetical protein